MRRGALLSPLGPGSREGAQTAPALLICRVPASAQGLVEQGGGWMLPGWGRLDTKNNTARSRTRWAAGAGGLFCFTVLLSLSPPLGFVALSCRAGKLFIQTAAPTTPSASICGSSLRCSSGWEVVNSSPPPGRPPARQDVRHRAADCATFATRPNPPGETCGTVPCYVPVPSVTRSLHSPCVGCSRLQVRLGSVQAARRASQMRGLWDRLLLDFRKLCKQQPLPQRGFHSLLRILEPAHL